MDESPNSSSLSQGQRFFLLFAVFVLAILLFFLRGGFDSQKPLDQLARRSLLPEIALTNGKPTILEFYADWCEICQKMAPAMLSAEKKSFHKLDFVLLNVDNERWQDLIDEYKVYGIPQLNFFDASGSLRGSAIGLRSEDQIDKLIQALLEDQPLPEFTGVGVTDQLLLSSFESKNKESFKTDKVKPTDHY